MRFKNIYSNLLHDRSLLCRLLLLTGWVLGILLGCIISSHLSVDDSLMHMLIFSRMSIVGGLAVCFLPLLITAIIIWFGKTWYLVPLAFAKAVLLGTASGIIMRAFSGAGWLLRWLYLFSDSVLSFSYVRLWFCITKESGIPKKELLYTAIYCLAVFIIDYFIVAPFVAILF